MACSFRFHSQASAYQQTIARPKKTAARIAAAIQGQCDRERQQSRAGTKGRDGEDAAAVLSALDDTVLHGRCNQEADREHEEGQPGAHEDAGQKRQALELLLENPVELKPE
jgi:hypothetical protein